MHLLIPFAQCLAPESQQAFDALKLSNLNRLLVQLPVATWDRGDENSLSPPHERVLAALRGVAPTGEDANAKALADGCLPWGAWHARRAGLVQADANEAWAVITPAQWAVQTRHITMTDPAALRLSEADSRALLALMAPYFLEDGIRLVYDTPTRWLASGEVFRGLATASVDRVAGRPVDGWLPKTAAAKALRRLQQEMQMLLYTHPYSEGRAQAGLPMVNTFWVSGTGVLPLATPDSQTAKIVSPSALRDAAVNEDWAVWAQAWQTIDATECAAALAAIKHAQDVTLTLCGERNAVRFAQGRRSVRTWIQAKYSSLLGLQVSNNVRNQL